MVITKNPHSDLASIACCAIGIIYEENLKDYPEAEEYYRRVLRNYPNSPEVYEAQEGLIHGI